MVGYLVKSIRVSQYYCPDEYNDFCRLGIVNGRLDYLKNPTEPLYGKHLGMNLIYDQIGCKRSLSGPREML